MRRVLVKLHFNWNCGVWVLKLFFRSWVQISAILSFLSFNIKILWEFSNWAHFYILLLFRLQFLISTLQLKQFMLCEILEPLLDFFQRSVLKEPTYLLWFLEVWTLFQDIIFILGPRTALIAVILTNPVIF